MAWNPTAVWCPLSSMLQAFCLLACVDSLAKWFTHRTGIWCWLSSGAQRRLRTKGLVALCLVGLYSFLLRFQRSLLFWDCRGRVQKVHRRLGPFYALAWERMQLTFDVFCWVRQSKVLLAPRQWDNGLDARPMVILAKEAVRQTVLVSIVWRVDSPLHVGPTFTLLLSEFAQPPWCSVCHAFPTAFGSGLPLASVCVLIIIYAILTLCLCSDTLFNSDPWAAHFFRTLQDFFH